MSPSRDMGAAFGVALIAIYILVVAQFGSVQGPARGAHGPCR